MTMTSSQLRPWAPATQFRSTSEAADGPAKDGEWSRRVQRGDESQKRTPAPPFNDVCFDGCVLAFGRAVPRTGEGRRGLLHKWVLGREEERVVGRGAVEQAHGPYRRLRERPLAIP